MIELIVFDKDSFNFNSNAEFVLLHNEIKGNKTNWIKLDGVFENKTLQDFSDFFSIHPLLIEDATDVHQLPKLENYDEHVFISLKSLVINKQRNDIVVEHISLVLGNNYLISLNESGNPIFQTLKTRLESDRGRIRKRSADFLCHQLMDVIVDNYFPIMEWLREQIENLEELIIEQPDENYIEQITKLKKHLSKLRRYILPLGEVTDKLTNSDNPLLKDENEIYFNDLNDHLQHLISYLDSHREMLANLVDLNNSNLNNKMNKIMKTLTIVSTIFIPITFIAGVYGMNFEKMPELGWKYGYFVILTIMLITGLGIWLWMKFKRWI